MPTESGNRRSGWFAVVRAVVISTFTMWVLSVLALVIYTWSAGQPEHFTLDIPRGTIELIATGANPLEIPRTWAFQADDTLSLINNDTVDHWLGNLFVPAEATRDYVLQPVYGGAFSCSLHPSGAITIEVEIRDFDLAAATIPTLAFGPALGLVALGVGRVMRLLDTDEDDEGAPADQDALADV